MIEPKSTSPCPGETNSPAAAGLAEFEVAAEDRAAPVERALGVLDVRVQDLRAELEHERRRVEELVLEVARVEVDPEALAVADRGERAPRRDEVVGDLGRVHLEREAHALGLEDVDDRAPALGELLVAALDCRKVVRRERVEHVPDRRAGEACYDLHAELGGGARGVLHPLGGAAAHALGFSVTPHVGVEHGAVALVDRVAYGLPDQVVADRPHAEPVALEQLAAAGAVAAVAQRLRDVEVVTPAGELEPVEAPLAALAGQRVERQVGPLAGEQRYGTAHVLSLMRRSPLSIASRRARA
jgi:hypothetical protein